MNEINLKKQLKQADQMSHLPEVDADSVIVGVRRRLNHRKQTRRYNLAAAAAIVVLCFFTAQKYQSWQKDRQIARLQQDVQELTRQTEATLAKLEQLLDSQETALQNVARYSDPEYKIKAAVDEAAFVLMYQAQRMTEKYNNKESAAGYYRQVIQYFADTPSAETAKIKLSQLEQNEQPNSI